MNWYELIWLNMAIMLMHSITKRHPIWKLFLVISSKSFFLAVGFNSYTACTACRFILLLSPLIWMYDTPVSSAAPLRCSINLCTLENLWGLPRCSPNLINWLQLQITERTGFHPTKNRGFRCWRTILTYGERWWYPVRWRKSTWFLPGPRKVR